ncbi:MAG: phosphoenolpyruvate--protein phosphotransferase [Gammaproteobacteria bacterium]|nr:phosphoenolpyruvate--protein phosphotransferase [Gammaproteobacteria bacterium]
MEHVIEELARIVQAVSKSPSQARQVSIIVESISRFMAVDVCSLYIADDNSTMQLIASHGLDRAAIGKVGLPAGVGLVGQVTKSGRPVNIGDAKSHPAYFYVAETHEEYFKSFCGVPLLRAGEVIGVLTVQSRQQRKLDEKEEAFLVTLAAQLVLLATSQTIPLILGNIVNTRITGSKASPGVAIGQVNICDSGGLFSVVDAACDNVEEAVTEWHRILDLVRNEIELERQLFGDKVSDNTLGIFGAYEMLLSDQSLVEGVESLIRQGNWLPGAVRQTIQNNANIFLAMEDPYLRARHEDIIHLGNKLYIAWKGTNVQQRYDGEAIILAGQQVSVSDIARVPAGKLVGIVCFEGSSYSHTSILANALGIPAVMDTGDIMAMHNGDTLIIDGYQGQVILQPDKSVAAEFLALVKQDRELDEQLMKLAGEPAVTTDGQVVQLLTNTGLLADISPGVRYGAEGVGLYRSEIPFMVNENFPTEDQQVSVYRQVLQAYQGKPVYMRTLDVGGDKQLPYFPLHNEDNPALGWRGIRFGLDNEAILLTQIQAMMRANEGIGNLHIMLPMVSARHELDQFHVLVNRVFSQLQSAGSECSLPPVGITLEVPAAISQLPFWKDKIDFISIGSNDLSQYLLAVDRNNARVSGYFTNTSPAVLSEIRRTIEICRELDIPVSLCGEMASDPVAVVILVGMGLHSLSMSASKLLRIKWLIRSISFERARELAEKALTLDNPAAIRQLIEEELKAMKLDQIIV